MAMMTMPVRVNAGANAMRGLSRMVRPHGMKGLGDEVANQLANEAVYSTYGYYTSPAYLASQASQLQADCATQPNDPSCVVAKATNDINVGYNPIADTTLNLTNYCQQNKENNAMFNIPLDTTNCTGSGVSSSVLAQVQAIGAKSTIPTTPAGLVAQGVVPSNPVTTTVPVTQNPGVAVQTNQPTNASSALVNTPSQAQQQTTDQLSTATTWIEDNWVLLAAALAAVVILPMVIKK